MTHHILIASEQLWPNLLGLAALIRRDGGVCSLHIVHTDDKRRSADPAAQLAFLATKMQSGIAPTLHPTGLTSQEVIGVIHSILQSLEDKDDKVSINATGGTKTMFAGLIPWVRLPNIEAFYREVSGAWFQLTPMEIDGLQVVGCEEWMEAVSVRIGLPVEQLATIQINHPVGASWQHQKPQSLDLPHVIQAGNRSGWDWPKLQQVVSQLGMGRSGFAFEMFFGGVLLACGADNVALNLEMTHDGKKRQEFDAILSTGEKIIVFDLKLTEAEPDAVIDQITRLGEDRRSLGGLNAVAVAVRPSWLVDPAIKAIAGSHNVEVWTQEDMGQLIPRIRTLIGKHGFSSDEVLVRSNALLADAAKQGQRLFSRSRSLLTTKSIIEQQVGWLNLHSYWIECSQVGKRAIVLELGGKYLIRYSIDGFGWKNQKDLSRNLPAWIVINWFICSKQASTALAVLSCPQEKDAELRAHLKFIFK